MAYLSETLSLDFVAPWQIETFWLHTMVEHLPPLLNKRGQLPSMEEQIEHPSKRAVLADLDTPLCINTAIDASMLPTTNGAYTGLNLQKDSVGKAYTADELVMNHGFRLIKWNGCDPWPVLDTKGRIYAVLAGRPSDPMYEKTCDDALALILELGQSEVFSPSEINHRRGNYPAIALGISQGNGNPTARRLKEEPHTTVVDKIRQHPAIQCIAEFGSSAFSKWAPNVYSFYQTYMDKLEAKIGDLRNFAGSIYACATVNFGPRVCTFEHHDVLNLAFGWCAITALGQFNPRRGGHMILWEPKLVIEYPSGATILIPSATVTHSNTAMAHDETRVSFTQYTAGGIFRWIDNGFKTLDSLKNSKDRSDKEKYAANVEAENGRWIKGLNMYSTLSDLISSN